MSRSVNRTIVLGFDGIDMRLASALMASGALPNLINLARSGSVHGVVSTTPAESGVAWTSFSTGMNPGDTGIFDFVERTAGSYLPRLTGSRVELASARPSTAARWALAGTVSGLAGAGGYRLSRRMTRRTWLKAGALLGGAAIGLAAAGVPLFNWLPDRVREWSSSVVGQPWWDRLAGQGQRSIAMRIPLTFPAHAREGVDLLAGLGVPDLCGTDGTCLVVTDKPAVMKKQINEEQVIRIIWEGDRSTVSIPGPQGLMSDTQAVEARLNVHRVGADEVRLGASGQSIAVRRGQWSSWLPLKFRFSPIVSRHGAVRVFFCDEPDATTLYMTPIELDAASSCRVNPISSPPAFSQDLCRKIGRYRTIGWETQTSALVDGVLDDAAYLTDVLDAMDTNELQLECQLKRRDWDNLMLVVQATDQASHMFFDDRLVSMRSGRPVDIQHPLVRVYRRMDQIVARAAEFAERNGCRLVVMSDHGFCPYRRSVNVNTWLARRGWLALKDKTKWDASGANQVLSGTLWSNVDWRNTRAYALGLAGIYLNVAGREPEGIVKHNGEYEFLQNKLIGELTSWTDSATNRRAFKRAYRRQDIYSGSRCDGSPDLVLGLEEGFRVSPGSVVGGIPEDEIVDNTSHWNGDHCGIDAPLIPGFCVTNFATDWPQQVPIDSLSSLIWADSGMEGLNA